MTDSTALRDWQAEIDRWTERFRDLPDAPEPFALAIDRGWRDGERDALAMDAEAEARRQARFVAELEAAGVDLVRFDAKRGSCGVCVKYVGKAFRLAGGPEGLPEAPVLPICPACRHTLNLLTPFFMQSLGLELEDLVADAQPFVDY